MQISGEKYRITCLSDSLIRFEWDEKGSFFDGQTQCVVNRAFPEVQGVSVTENEEIIIDCQCALV